ncbi:MAG: ATP-binding protein [Ruminococcus sp.]|nr:ATP-binding protein [Ruminococcus sp.]
MGYSKKVRREAIALIQERKLNAERDADYRRQRIFSQLPEARSLERQIASCGIRAGRAVLRGGNVKEELLKLKEESLRLQSEYEKLLSENGFSVSDTEPKYYCSKCSDTGYLELENRTELCSCLKNAMVEIACRELNKKSPLSLCTFEDFKLDYYSKEKTDGYPRSPYEQLSMIYKKCKAYADSFSADSKSLLMMGRTGLGKTHLSLAIANEVIKKGCGVIYASAPTIVSQIEKEHFGKIKTDEESVEDTLLNCDLLIIDDLGTEFNNKFTTPAIYNIFNSRITAGKPVIVSTNLKISELNEIYSDRFVSRIIGEAERLDFFGSDIRVIKRKMQN